MEKLAVFLMLSFCRFVLIFLKFLMVVLVHVSLIYFKNDFWCPNCGYIMRSEKGKKERGCIVCVGCGNLVNSNELVCASERISRDGYEEYFQSQRGVKNGKK